MTEVDWLTCSDPARLLAWLLEGWPGRKPSHASAAPSGRKLRLWACACCRQVSSLPALPYSRRAVRVAERYADGEASLRDMDRAWTDSLCPPGASPTPVALAASLVAIAGPVADRLPGIVASVAGLGAAPGTEAALLRDIFGNPFRPVQLHPRCLTPTVLSVARRAYDDRRQDGTLDPACLAVLADALEDGGCETGAALRHLRGRTTCPECLGGGDGTQVYCLACGGAGAIGLPGPHVRGCHALDIVLGKS